MEKQQMTKIDCLASERDALFTAFMDYKNAELRFQGAVNAIAQIVYKRNGLPVGPNMHLELPIDCSGFLLPDGLIPNPPAGGQTHDSTD